MVVQNDRILKEIGLTSPTDCLGYRLIVKSVERVADHASRIAQEVQAIKKPSGGETFKKNQVTERICASGLRRVWIGIIQA